MKKLLKTFGILLIFPFSIFGLILGYLNLIDKGMYSGLSQIFGIFIIVLTFGIGTLGVFLIKKSRGWD